jgi:hypothetical protein
VNVSVNPAGRFGAPEIEPGPSGVGGSAEAELMTIPFTSGIATVAQRARASRP